MINRQADEGKQSGCTASTFNVREALGRLMNNKGLYQKLLSRFEGEYNSYDEKVRAAVAANEFEEVMRLAHTMKGLSGNLGADDLTEASKDLEIAGKAGCVTPELESAIQKFSDELQRAVLAVRDGVDLG